MMMIWAVLASCSLIGVCQPFDETHCLILEKNYYFTFEYYSELYCELMVLGNVVLKCIQTRIHDHSVYTALCSVALGYVKKELMERQRPERFHFLSSFRDKHYKRFSGPTTTLEIGTTSVYRDINGERLCWLISLILKNLLKTLRVPLCLKRNAEILFALISCLHPAQFV